MAEGAPWLNRRSRPLQYLDSTSSQPGAEEEDRGLRQKNFYLTEEEDRGLRQKNFYLVAKRTSIPRQPGAELEEL